MKCSLENYWKDVMTMKEIIWERKRKEEEKKKTKKRRKQSMHTLTIHLSIHCLSPINITVITITLPVLNIFFTQLLFLLILLVIAYVINTEVRSKGKQRVLLATRKGRKNWLKQFNENPQTDSISTRQQVINWSCKWYVSWVVCTWRVIVEFLLL